MSVCRLVIVKALRWSKIFIISYLIDSQQAIEPNPYKKKPAHNEIPCELNILRLG